MLPPGSWATLHDSALPDDARHAACVTSPACRLSAGSCWSPQPRRTVEHDQPRVPGGHGLHRAVGGVRSHEGHNTADGTDGRSRAWTSSMPTTAVQPVLAAGDGESIVTVGVPTDSCRRLPPARPTNTGVSWSIPDLTTDVMITGAEFVPGNPAIVHHSILYCGLSRASRRRGSTRRGRSRAPATSVSGARDCPARPAMRCPGLDQSGLDHRVGARGQAHRDALGPRHAAAGRRADRHPDALQPALRAGDGLRRR